MRRLGWVVLVAVAVGLLGAGVPSAQDIKGPIKIVVPYPAGGGSDVVARLIAAWPAVRRARRGSRSSRSRGSRSPGRPRTSSPGSARA